MTGDDDADSIQGSDNAFHDFDDPKPDLEQARAILAAKIIATLDARKLTVRAAEAATGFAAAEFSRIRNARLARVTLDRIIRVLGKLDEEVEVTLEFRQCGAADAAIEHAEHVVLSERDARLCLDLLDKPPAPNDRLIAAAKALPCER